MGKLLEKLFTWQYFEPVLFTTIGVLLLLLFIVLFLGKKDQKKKLEETKKLELDALKKDSDADTFAKEEKEEKVEVKDEEPIVIKDEIEKEEPKEEKEEETKEEKEETPEEDKEPEIVPDFEVFAKPEEDKEEPIIPEVVKEEEKEEEKEIPIVATPEENNEPISVVDDVVKSSVVPEEEAKEKEAEVEVTDEKIAEFKNNFADLASSISKELDEINKMQNEISVHDEEPAKEDLPLPGEVDVTPIKEATKFTPSDVFSSVYSPSKNIEEEKPALKEEASEGNPFLSDMPAKKEDIELPKENKEPVNVPDFSAFDNETFNINK